MSLLIKLFHFLLLSFIAFFISSCVHKGVGTATVSKAQEAKVAMILPQKRIGRYAHTTSTAVFAYFLTREHPFSIKTFQIADETPKEIKRVLDEIEEQGFRYVIAPVTLKGARVIAEEEDDISVYFPTIHKNDLPGSAHNIYFGAIDYRAQIKKLAPLASSPLVVMYDKSVQGLKLLEMTKESYLESSKPFYPTRRKSAAIEDKTAYDPGLEPKKKNLLSYAIDKKRSNLKYLLDNNKKIQFGSFFLNIPVIKSTMTISQFSVYDTEYTNVLSTQINYDPLLLTMTQKKARKNLYIANSISLQDDRLVQANALLSNDIVYDWINYATSIGADFFYHQITGEERTYALEMVNNQVIYPITIVQPTESHFVAVNEADLP